LIYSLWLPLWYLQSVLASIISFLCSVLYIIVCPFVLFLLVIVLTVLWFTVSDYLFGIFNLFLPQSFVFCVVFYRSLFVLLSFRQYSDQKEKGETMIYKTLHRKLKIEARKDWRYQRGNQKLYIKGQSIQWPKEKGQKDKQWSIKHYTENKRLRQEKIEDTKEVFSFLCIVLYIIVVLLLLVILLSVLRRFTVSDYPFGIIKLFLPQSLVFCVLFYRSLFVLLSFFFWSLYCLFFHLQLLITRLISSNFSCLNL
jgi:hypothetical protein